MYKKLFFLVVTGMAMLIGCKKEGQSNLNREEKNDEGFLRYEKTFLEELWKIDPDWGTTIGYHTNDSLLVLPGEQRKKMMDLVKQNLDSLSRYPENELSDANRMDFYLIQNFLRANEWKIQQLKQHEWDPTTYNLAGFAYILNQPYAPLPKRLKSLNDKLENLPAYFKEAQKQIKNPVPELTDLAIEQLTARADMLEKAYADSLHGSAIPEVEEKAMIERAKLGAAAVKSFVAWLKTVRSDKGRSFRLGKELYDEKFQQVVQSSFTAQQVFNSAVERKKFLHKQMIKTGRQLWPKYMADKNMPADSLEMVGELITAINAKQTGTEKLQAAIRQQLQQLTTFVQSKELLTPDASKPLMVRTAPRYDAAHDLYISVPGPYDKELPAYYYVPAATGADKEKIDAVLQQYDEFTLQIANIHNAVPGYFTQQVAANNTGSLVKAILANDAMKDGWAVYAGEIMVDAGYGETTPEIKLMWYKWHLRTVSSAILDYSVHTGGMTKSAAIKMLTKEAFVTEPLAEILWQQVTLSSAKLAGGFTGYKELIDLRDAYKKKMADKYRIKEFHDKLLTFGNAPVKYIKEAMLAKEKQTEGN